LDLRLPDINEEEEEETGVLLWINTGVVAGVRMMVGVGVFESF
jgi:hypothetical protein